MNLAELSSNQTVAKRKTTGKGGGKAKQLKPAAEKVGGSVGSTDPVPDDDKDSKEDMVRLLTSVAQLSLQSIRRMEQLTMRCFLLQNETGGYTKTMGAAMDEWRSLTKEQQTALGPPRRMLTVKLIQLAEERYQVVDDFVKQVYPDLASAFSLGTLQGMRGHLEGALPSADYLIQHCVWIRCHDQTKRVLKLTPGRGRLRPPLPLLDAEKMVDILTAPLAEREQHDQAPRGPLERRLQRALRQK